MSQKALFRWILFASMLAMITLSCSLFGSLVENQIDKTIATQAEAIITQADIGSIVTQADLGALATQIDVESLVTQINPDEIFDTFGTMMPEPENTGEKPEGIPIMEPNKDFITSKTHVEYVTQKTVKEATAFYEQQMPANGWTKVAAESRVETDLTTLVFTKDNRKATIKIEEDFFGDGTTVSIDIVQS